MHTSVAFSIPAGHLSCASADQRHTWAWLSRSAVLYSAVVCQLHALPEHLLDLVSAVGAAPVGNVLSVEYNRLTG